MIKKKSYSSFEDSTLKYYILLAIAAFAVYANSLSNDFVFDDESLVAGDRSIRNLSNIPGYFTAREGFHKIVGKYYRPLVSASYALDYSLWELKPFGYHTTNILIHLINTLLLFYFLLLILGRDGKVSRTMIYGAFLGSLIFAVHPIHTEAVAWVSGRTDSLCFTFFIAAFICYIKYASDPGKTYLFFSILFYLPALLAKEMAVTFPVIIILYDLLIGKTKDSTNREFIKSRIPAYITIVIITLLFILLRSFLLRDVPERIYYNYFYGKNFTTILATTLQTIPYYLRLVLVPAGMLYHYSGYLPFIDSFLNLKVIIALFFIILCTAAAVYSLKKNPILSFCIFFFFVTLLPVLNIVPGVHLMAERFLYLPSAALSLMLAAVFVKYYSPAYRYAFVFATVVLIGMYSYLTVMRNGVWKDNESLYYSAGNKLGTVTSVNLGNIYSSRGKIDEAMTYYKKSLSMREENILAHNNLGKMFILKQMYDSAVFHVNKAHLYDTLSPEPIYTLAQIYERMGDLPLAVGYLEELQKISADYMNSSQMLDGLKKDLVTARLSGLSPADMIKVTRLELESQQYFADRKYDLSIGKIQEALKLNPGHKHVYCNNIGLCYLAGNNLDEAEKSFNLSIEANPNFSEAYSNLGKLYLMKGNTETAKQKFLIALEKDPNNLDARNNLDALK